MIRPGATAGYQVQGYDISEHAVRSWAERAGGARPAASPGAAAAGAAAVILMLPDSAVVRSVLAGLVPAPGAVVVDMSSSEPLVTRELAAEIARLRPLTRCTVPPGSQLSRVRMSTCRSA